MIVRTSKERSVLLPWITDDLKCVPLRERYLAAGNEQTDEDLLTELAFDCIDCVRQHVAENPNTPVVVLSCLAFDDSVDVRISVADHPSTPLSVIEILAQDHCDDVRYSIAENHNMPDHVLSQLCHDENPFVACRASLTLEHKIPVRIDCAA